jgi:hypothetical protein
MIDANLFVEIFSKSASIAEVSASLGMPAQDVRTRAARYRKLGVNLKKFARPVLAGRKPLDITALNAIVAAAGG